MHTDNIPRLFTVKQFCQKHTAFTEGGIRDRIFYADFNKLNEYKAIIRNGRRVLIDEDKFFNWLQDSNK
jgi:hypothetical protein